MNARFYLKDGATQADINHYRRYFTCAECGGRLAVWLDNGGPYLACKEQQRNHHEGIAKPYENTEQKIGNQTVDFRGGKNMVTETALAKYQGVTSLTKEDAGTIIDTMWPGARKASPAEVFKAVSICQQYHLNPLMRHLFLIPFDKKEKRGDTWVVVAKNFVTVLGIGANRLIASRKHSYSYIDDSPRMMTEEEQMKILGEVDRVNLRAITILKDMRSGASARGYGAFPKDGKVQGADKGNTPANMVFIRSERQALDRLYPAELPDAPVIDEQYGEVTATVEPSTIPPPADAPAAEVKEAEPPTDTAGDQQNAQAEAGMNESQAKTGKPTKDELMAMKFKTVGDFMQACLTQFGLQPSAVQKEAAMFELHLPLQRERAWQQIVGARM